MNKKHFEEVKIGSRVIGWAEINDTANRLKSLRVRPGEVTDNFFFEIDSRDPREPRYIEPTESGFYKSTVGVGNLIYLLSTTGLNWTIIHDNGVRAPTTWSSICEGLGVGELVRI